MKRACGVSSVIPYLLQESADVVSRVQGLDTYQGVTSILSAQPRVHLTGVGKSGLIAQRAAATWRSFGIDATYEHSTELLHGGLGGIRGIILLVSHSGKTKECIEVANANAATIALTSDSESALSKKCRYELSYGKVDDTTFAHGLPVMVNYVQAAILDSIGLDIMITRGIATKEMIQRWHPGGSIK